MADEPKKTVEKKSPGILGYILGELGEGAGAGAIFATLLHLFGAFRNGSGSPTKTTGQPATTGAEGGIFSLDDDRQWDTLLRRFSQKVSPTARDAVVAFYNWRFPSKTLGGKAHRLLAGTRFRKYVLGMSPGSPATGTTPAIQDEQVAFLTELAQVIQSGITQKAGFKAAVKFLQSRDAPTGLDKKQLDKVGNPGNWGPSWKTLGTVMAILIGLFVILVLIIHCTPIPE